MAAVADVQRSLSDLPEQTLATLQEVPWKGGWNDQQGMIPWGF